MAPDKIEIILSGATVNPNEHLFVKVGQALYYNGGAK